FHRTARLSTVRPIRDDSYDLQPIFALLRAWGPNDKLPLHQLARKTAWLLATVGFLRPSDLARIDVAQCTDREGPQGFLRLAIDAPKEKRHGLRYVRSVSYHIHPDPILCPVQAYRAYRRATGFNISRSPHPIITGRLITPLFRMLHQHDRPVQVDTIRGYICDVMRHVGRDPPSLPVPKARALGATLAAQAGTPIADIVSRGAWSSQDMFDHFYRISSATHTDFTRLTLEDPTSQQTSKCNMM
ncbi:hypothetical protein BCR43DRAFT_448488, partial [Syncephalastrum racemosum]